MVRARMRGTVRYESLLLYPFLFLRLPLTLILLFVFLVLACTSPVEIFGRGAIPGAHHWRNGQRPNNCFPVPFGSRAFGPVLGRPKHRAEWTSLHDVAIVCAGARGPTGIRSPTRSSRAVHDTGVLACLSESANRNDIPSVKPPELLIVRVALVASGGRFRGSIAMRAIWSEARLGGVRAEEGFVENLVEFNRRRQPPMISIIGKRRGARWCSYVQRRQKSQRTMICGYSRRGGK